MEITGYLDRFSAQELASIYAVSQSLSKFEIKEYVSNKDDYFKNVFNTLSESPELLDAQPKGNEPYSIHKV